MNAGSGPGRGVIGRLLLLLGLAFLGLAAITAIALVSRGSREAAAPAPAVVPTQQDDVVIAPGDQVQHDVTTTKGAILIGRDAVVDGNVTAIGGAVTVAENARVNGDVTTQGGTVSIAGRITGNVSTLSGDVILAATAQVDHNLVTTSGMVYQARGARVDGATTALPGKVFNGLPSPQMPGATEGSGLLDLLLHLIAVVALSVLALIAGAVVLVVAPRPVARVEATLEHAFLASAIVGVLTAVLLPIVAFVVFFVLSFTLIGPFVAGFLGLAAGFLGLVGLGLWIGERLAHSSAGARLPQAPLARGLLGLILIVAAAAALGLVWPGLGFLALYLLGCLGGGAVVLSRFGTVVPINDHVLPFGLRRPTHPLAGSPPEPPAERKAS